MRYLLALHFDEPDADARTDEEKRAGLTAHAPYIERLRQNGLFDGSEPLTPSRSARTLRSVDGKVVATDGPFAESREQIGGYYVLLADDLDLAIAWAEQCPALDTVAAAVEIRPMTGALAEGGVVLLLRRDEGEDDDLADLTGWATLADAASATTVRRGQGLIDGPWVDGPVQLVAVRTARDLEEAGHLAVAAVRGTRSVEMRQVRERPSETPLAEF